MLDTKNRLALITQLAVCGAVVLLAAATPAVGQDDDQPVLSDLTQGLTYYSRAGVSYGWAGDQQVYGAQPSPPDSADFNDVWGGSIATGVDWGVLLGDDLADDPFTLRLRTDFEIGYEALFYDGFPAPVGVTDDSDGVISSWTFTPNAFLDVTLPGPFSVFGGAGVGLAVLTVDEDGFSETDTSAVWQWMFGVEARVRQDLLVYSQYRVRTYLNDLDFGGPRLDDLRSGAIEIGIRLEF